MTQLLQNQEKHKVSAKRSWRKLHIAVDDKHIIHVAELTDRFISDDQVVANLVKKIDNDDDQLTADGAYDKNPVYDKITEKFPSDAIIIPPDSDAVYNTNAHPQRNQNLQDIKTFGRMHWQRIQSYGNRNISELAIQRYKKILGNKLHIFCNSYDNKISGNLSWFFYLVHAYFVISNVGNPLNVS